MNNNDVEFIQKFIKNHSAIVIGPGKEYLIESRLIPIAKELSIPSVEALINELRIRPTEPLKLKVIDAMTTNETLFFRDIHPFDLLKNTIIPELITKREKQKKLTIWCAAASSGQEPYTIAMILNEFSEQLKGWTITFVASDISEKILEKAKAGLYSQLEVNRGLPVPYLVKYFDKEGANWRIKKELRDMINYQKINITSTWPLFSVDLVFMRNILIYFDIETKKDIFKRLEKVLVKDGYLFLGGSETILDINNEFERITFGKVPCYKLKN